MGVSVPTSWFILGALHLIAWNFNFPTKTEKIIWHAASLVLAGSALVSLVMLGLYDIFHGSKWYKRPTTGIFKNTGYLCILLGVLSRVLLVALMLASLRALPCTAYQTVPWTAYIPHL